MEIDKLNSWLLKNNTKDASIATHMVWKNPSPTPVYCRMTPNDHFEINKMIAKAFSQSFNPETREFFSYGLPSVHERANEIFPVFMDIDNVPVTTSMETVKKLVAVVCTLIARTALEMSEGTKVTVFVNNPKWVVHQKQWRPKSKATPKKYGVHIYFQDDDDGVRPLVTSPMMKAITAFVNKYLKSSCHKEQTPEERENNKTCVTCQATVDEQLFASEDGHPKLRMAYCDKGHPYDSRYYGLCCRLKWDGHEFKPDGLVGGDWELHLDRLEELIEEASIRNINPGVYKDADDKWIVSPFIQGGSFVNWFLKQMNFKNLKKKMIRTISRPALAAFWSVKLPVLLHYDQDFLEIQREVNLLMKQDLKNNPEREAIVQQAFDMMNQGVLYFQSESKWYQIATLQGRLVLKPIEKTAHAFGVSGLKIPRPEPKRNKKGETVIEWKYDDFHKKFLDSEHPRYQFFEWSPEALNPNYDVKKLGGNFNAFSGFVRDASYFIKLWQENQGNEALMNKVDILRDWVRIGICGGQVPYKTHTHQYEKFTRQYLEFLEMLIKNMIMFPWNRSGVFVVLYGDQGTGKGWLVNTLAKRIYGDNSPLFRSVTNADHVFGHYSLDGENECLMMFFDETEINTKAHIASLKNATTETNRNANYKFKAQAQIQTWWQGFLATNSPTPVLIKGNERRIFVVCTKLIENTVFPQWIQSIVNDPLVFDLWLGRICSSYPQVTDQWHAQSARPQTFAYHNLKIRSFSPLSSWWLDCMRRGWHTREPMTNDEKYYAQHQNRPSLVWRNNTDDKNWNDLVSRHWLFQSYYLQAKDFVSLKGYNKGQPDDPLTKFLSELVPMVHGPKFGLANIPEVNTLLKIPDLKTCVENFCRFHFISDPSVLHIRGVTVDRHINEEEENPDRDPWERMKGIFDKKLKRRVTPGTTLLPPRPTPIRASVIVTPPPPAEPEEDCDTNGSPLYTGLDEDSFIDNSYINDDEESEEDEEVSSFAAAVKDAKSLSTKEKDEIAELWLNDRSFGEEEEEIVQPAKRQKKEETYEEWQDRLNGQELPDEFIYSVTAKGEKERGKEIPASSENPFLYT